MKKRLLTVLLVVCLVVALGTVTAMADDTVVAQIGDTTYDTLSSAFANAVDGSEIVLLRDVTGCGRLSLTDGRSIVVNLNGHNIGFAANGYFYVHHGSLTLTGTGVVKEEYPYYAPVLVEGAETDLGNNYAVVNVGENVTLEGWSGVFIDYAGTSSGKNHSYGVNVTVNGTINSVLDTSNAAGHGVYINGTIQDIEGSVPVIALGETSSITSQGNGIYAAGYAIWTLAGDVTAPNALSIKSGTFTINSGNYTSTGEFAEPATPNGNGSEDTGAALSITSNKAYAGKTDVTVNGGTFVSQNGHAVYEGIAYSSTSGAAAEASYASIQINNGVFEAAEGKDAVSIEEAENKKVISGGTFTSGNATSDVSEYYIAGAALTQDENGTIVEDTGKNIVARVDGIGFTDLASAIAAADDGDTVEIIDDCTLESSVAIRENITIEGGNHTVTAKGAAFYIQADLESFTVQNLTLKGAEYSGTYGEGNDDKSGPWMGIGTYNGGYGVADLTLTNVTIDGFSYGLYFGGSTSNKNPVSVDADNLVIQNCAIKGAYFEKLTDSEFTDCQILNNGADATKVDSNFTSWMCGVDINLKYGDYENIVFDGCNFEGNGANNGTALHVKARDDGNYSTDSASLTGVTVTGCTFEDNHGTNDIIIGEPNADNKTPVDVNIQPDVPFTNNLAENATFTVEFKGDYTDDLPVRVVASGDEITLPTPTRSGYEFRGWRDGSGELHKAGDVVTVDSDMTFTAVWSAINIPDTYDIKIADAANGSVDTSLSNASAGSTITITATPDSGYSVASVTVTGPDGRVDVVRVNATTYTFRMPAGDVTVRVTFTDSDALPFTDVSAGQWFYDAVAYVYTNGMMEGDSATTFNPDGTMTRAMFWAVLGRIDGATITGTNWADQARDWAMAESVSDGTDPNGLVTREQMVTMLWRYAGEPESTASLSAYTDADSVSDWAETAMRWAIDEGIITGMTDTTLVPQGTATRAQCAAIFMRFDQM